MATTKRTSPAFQFYPKDFFSSSSVQRMSMTERGVYITLLGIQWLDGSLPADLGKLARLCNLPLRQFERMWPHELEGRFVIKNGRLVNERLEHERRVQAEYRRKQKENAEKGWQRRRDATALPESHRSGDAPLPLSSSSSASSNKEKRSAEPPSDSTPTVMVFPVRGSEREWALRESLIASWREAYHSMDVLAECRKALAWAQANPGKQKTAKGMPGFLVNWLNRAADSPRTFAAPQPVSRGPVVPSAEETREYMRKQLA